MRTIAELNLLLRARVELPEDLRLATEEFHEGWNLSRSVDARRLEKKILDRGWSFIKIDGGALRSGVGDTSQEAITSALKLALRHISEHFNTVEVEHIELTQYPWFFLARVRINPYRIQQSAVVPVLNNAGSLPATPRRKRLPRQSAVLCPYSSSAVPMLKDMLILSRSTLERT
jgi:hypothetical protein